MHAQTQIYRLKNATSQELNSFNTFNVFQVEFEFGRVGFWWGEGKTGVPGEEFLGARERTNNKTYEIDTGTSTMDISCSCRQSIA